MRICIPPTALEIIWQLTVHQIQRVQQRIPSPQFVLVHKLSAIITVELTYRLHRPREFPCHLNHLGTGLRRCCRFHLVNHLHHFFLLLHFHLLCHQSCCTHHIIYFLLKPGRNAPIIRDEPDDCHRPSAIVYVGLLMLRRFFIKTQNTANGIHGSSRKNLLRRLIHWYFILIELNRTCSRR